MEAVAKSYMRKDLLIYEEMRKYVIIYEEAFCRNRSLRNFLYIWGKFCFLFFSVWPVALEWGQLWKQIWPVALEWGQLWKQIWPVALEWGKLWKQIWPVALEWGQLWKQIWPVALEWGHWCAGGPGGREGGEGVDHAPVLLWRDRGCSSQGKE